MLRAIALLTAGLTVAAGLNLGVASTAAARSAGYDSAYLFESAFLSLKPGDSGVLSVFFANTGTMTWMVGSPSEVDLAVCAPDKATCRIASAQGSWASGWLSATAYATATKASVAPGDFSAFSYQVKVPPSVRRGLYRFTGDLVLASSGDRIHPEGYYHDVSVEIAAPSGGLSVTPAYGVTEDLEASTVVPGRGQHAYTFRTGLTGTLSFAVMPTADIGRIADGLYGFCDQTQSSKAQDVGSEQAFIVAVNGTAIAPTNPLLLQAVPASGTITITVDSAIRNERVRVVAWQDLNGNGQIDLTGPGDADCADLTTARNDTVSDGAMIVSGRAYWFGPPAQFGDAGGCVPIYRNDLVNEVLSAGPPAADLTMAGSVSLRGSNSLRYSYSGKNVVFRVRGTAVARATWKAEVDSAADGSRDSVSINYDPNATGMSTFDLCTRLGWDAPSDLVANVGNYDNGTVADDVLLSFTSPGTNIGLDFDVQRATRDATGATVTTATCTASGSPNPSGGEQTIGVSNGSAAAGDFATNNAPNDGSASPIPSANFVTLGSASADIAGKGASFVNNDVAIGRYCYRVRIIDPNLGVASYSNYLLVNATGGAPLAGQLTSSQAILSTSAGFAGQLNVGDVILFLFDDTGAPPGLGLASNAVIRVADSDCGPWSDTAPPNQPSCTGANSDTVADIICGTNATCTTADNGAVADGALKVRIVGSLRIVSPGAVAGLQFPLRVVDSSGVTDLGGNPWDLRSSTDTVFGPKGQ